MGPMQALRKPKPFEGWRHADKVWFGAMIAATIFVIAVLAFAEALLYFDRQEAAEQAKEIAPPPKGPMVYKLD